MARMSWCLKSQTRQDVPGRNIERVVEMTKCNGLNYIPDRAVKGRSWARVIVIGGGQAGLAIGHFLKKATVDFLIPQAGKRLGPAWRRRCDYLRLFSPALPE